MRPSTTGSSQIERNPTKRAEIPPVIRDLCLHPLAVEKTFRSRERSTREAGLHRGMGYRKIPGDFRRQRSPVPPEGFVAEGPYQKPAELGAGEGAGPQACQVSGFDLAVDQLEVELPEAGD